MTYVTWNGIPPCPPPPCADRQRTDERTGHRRPTRAEMIAHLQTSRSHLGFSQASWCHPSGPEDPGPGGPGGPGPDTGCGTAIARSGALGAGLADSSCRSHCIGQEDQGPACRGGSHCVDNVSAVATVRPTRQDLIEWLHAQGRA